MYSKGICNLMNDTNRKVHVQRHYKPQQNNKYAVDPHDTTKRNNKMWELNQLHAKIFIH